MAQPNPLLNHFFTITEEKQDPHDEESPVMAKFEYLELYFSLLEQKNPNETLLLFFSEIV